MGREPEVQLLQRLLAGARIGRSAVLVMTGEAGIGKTTLLAEAAQWTTGMRILRAVGSEPESAVPFGGLLQLLRPALGLLDQIPPPRSAALAEALALRAEQPEARAGSPGDRFAVGAATLSLLCRYAEEAPVAVFVDDLQLLDVSSAQALFFAARRLMADPVVLIATSRVPAADHDDDVWAGLDQLRLTGISLEGAHQLISSQAHDVVDPQTAARLHRATSGNPLALIELANDLEALEATSPETPIPVSKSLAKAFAARARKLDRAQRMSLLVAAVTGGDLRITARACADLACQTGSLTGAEGAGLIRIRDDRVDFEHPLIRSAVYRAASPEDRRAAHHAVAAALPADDVERRAWHLAESAVGPDLALLTCWPSPATEPELAARTERLRWPISEPRG